MDQRALDLLRHHGWNPGEPLGGGVEGDVFALTDTVVAKVWHGRSAADLEPLQRFTAALARCALPFGTPQVHEVLRSADASLDGDHLVTVERRLTGRPLRTDSTAPAPATSADAQLLGDVLAAFAAAPVEPDLALLPVLPGEPSFDPARSFGQSLADLVEHRLARSAALLRHRVDDLDQLARLLTGRLRSRAEAPESRLLHGDLIPGNVLIDNGRTSAVLDFGFLTTLGDPAFDAAITASIFDMYGPNARASEETLSRAFGLRFDHDPELYDLYRGAYAIATSLCFSDDGSDGHFAWCVRMLARPEVRAAAGIS